MTEDKKKQYEGKIESNFVKYIFRNFVRLRIQVVIEGGFFSEITDAFVISSNTWTFYLSGLKIWIFEIFKGRAKIRIWGEGFFTL